MTPVGDELGHVARLRAVHSLPVPREPPADRLRPNHELGRQLAIRRGADVQEQVAAAAGGFDQHVQQEVGGAPVLADGVTPQPPGAHLAGLPHPLRVGDDLVFRRAKVAQDAGAPDAFLGRVRL